MLNFQRETIHVVVFWKDDNNDNDNIMSEVGVRRTTRRNLWAGLGTSRLELWYPHVVVFQKDMFLKQQHSNAAKRTAMLYFSANIMVPIF